jgi:hypothetical protein
LAFHRLAHMFRTDTPSHKYALSYWVSEANNWAHLHGYDGTVEAGYLATVLAHSDICFTPGAPNHGFVWELGLSPYQGRPATDAGARFWKPPSFCRRRHRQDFRI